VWRGQTSARRRYSARREALEAGASARFAVADFRALDTQVPGTFDLVISCDNALPHLLTGEDLRLGVRNMRSKLPPAASCW
jgi:glycine/sarcosine N-methyltransferase